MQPFDLLMQEHFDSDFQPGAGRFLGRYPSEEQLARVHKAREDHVVRFGNIANFHTVGVFDDNRPVVVRIIGRAPQVQTLSYLRLYRPEVLY